MEKAFADKLQGQVLQFKQTTSKGVGDGILKAATTKKAMVGAQCGCLAVVWYQAAPLVFLDLLGFFVHLCFAIKTSYLNIEVDNSATCPAPMEHENQQCPDSC